MRDKLTDYSCGFAFNEAGTKVALIEKQRPDWMVGKWNGIGGHVEEGESPLDCMRREFAEETGLWVPTWEPYLDLTSASRTWRVHFFRARPVALDELRTLTDERVHAWRVDDLAHLPLVEGTDWQALLALNPAFKGMPDRIIKIVDDTGVPG